jgi:transposase
MRIDDKAIGHDGFTVLSSSDTGKIAMPVETATADGVESVMEKIGGCLRKIKNLSMDMIPVYAPVFNSFVPRAVQVADLLHHSVAGQVEQRKGRDDASGF